MSQYNYFRENLIHGVALHPPSMIDFVNLQNFDEVSCNLITSLDRKSIKKKNQSIENYSKNNFIIPAISQKGRSTINSLDPSWGKQKQQPNSVKAITRETDKKHSLGINHNYNGSLHPTSTNPHTSWQPQCIHYQIHPSQIQKNPQQHFFDFKVNETMAKRNELFKVQECKRKSKKRAPRICECCGKDVIRGNHRCEHSLCDQIKCDKRLRRRHSAIKSNADGSGNIEANLGSVAGAFNYDQKGSAVYDPNNPNESVHNKSESQFNIGLSQVQLNRRSSQSLNHSYSAQPNSTIRSAYLLSEPPSQNLIKSIQKIITEPQESVFTYRVIQIRQQQQQSSHNHIVLDGSSRNNSNDEGSDGYRSAGIDGDDDLQRSRPQQQRPQPQPQQDIVKNRPTVATKSTLDQSLKREKSSTNKVTKQQKQKQKIIKKEKKLDSSKHSFSDQKDQKQRKCNDGNAQQQKNKESNNKSDKNNQNNQNNNKNDNDKNKKQEQKQNNIDVEEDHQYLPFQRDRISEVESRSEASENNKKKYSNNVNNTNIQTNKKGKQQQIYYEYEQQNMSYHHDNDHDHDNDQQKQQQQQLKQKGSQKENDNNGNDDDGNQNNGQNKRTQNQEKQKKQNSHQQQDPNQVIQNQEILKQNDNDELDFGFENDFRSVQLGLLMKKSQVMWKKNQKTNNILNQEVEDDDHIQYQHSDVQDVDADAQEGKCFKCFSNKSENQQNQNIIKESDLQNGQHSNNSLDDQFKQILDPQKCNNEKAVSRARIMSAEIEQIDPIGEMPQKESPQKQNSSKSPQNSIQQEIQNSHKENSQSIKQYQLSSNQSESVSISTNKKLVKSQKAQRKNIQFNRRPQPRPVDVDKIVEKMKSQEFYQDYKKGLGRGKFHGMGKGRSQIFQEKHQAFNQEEDDNNANQNQ